MLTSGELVSLRHSLGPAAGSDSGVLVSSEEQFDEFCVLALQKVYADVC